jgi:site-specific recombinase XerD
MENGHFTSRASVATLALAVSPIDAAYEDFVLSRKAMRCTPSTLDHYKYSAGAFVAWLRQRNVTKPEEVASSRVREWLAEAAPRLRDTSLHARARGVRTFLRFLRAEAYISQPVRFEMPRLEQKRLPFLNEEQLRVALRAAKTARDRALILFLADSGLRRAEALALTWGNLDFGTGAVVVERGKGGKARSAAVGAHTRRALLRYRRTLSRNRPEDPIWQTYDGRRLDAMGLRSALDRISDRAGVHVSPHALRRTFATLSLRSGMDVLTLQRLLGHSSLEMTMHYAAQLDGDLIREHAKHGLDEWL